MTSTKTDDLKEELIKEFSELAIELDTDSNKILKWCYKYAQIELRNMVDRKKYYEFFVKEIIKVRRSWRIFECILGYDYEIAKRNNIQSPLLIKLPVFTDRVLHGLMESVLMAISRLADPMKTAGKDNVTVERLMECVELDVVEKLQMSSLKKNVKEFLVEARSEEVRKIRNRIFAHNCARFIAGDDNVSVDMTKINKLVYRLAKMGEQIKSIDEGTGINISTGRGMVHSHEDVVQCEEEVEKLNLAALGDHLD